MTFPVFSMVFCYYDWIILMLNVDLSLWLHFYGCMILLVLSSVFSYFFFLFWKWQLLNIFQFTFINSFIFSVCAIVCIMLISIVELLLIFMIVIFIKLITFMLVFMIVIYIVFIIFLFSWCKIYDLYSVNSIFLNVYLSYNVLYYNVLLFSCIYNQSNQTKDIHNKRYKMQLLVWLSIIHFLK